LEAHERIHSVVIVGAGFGGVGMAIKLKKAGDDDYVVLERASGPGGVWQTNRYPGAACDVESHLYSYSFATNFDWSSAHGKRDEIISYFNHCIDHFKIADHIRYGNAVEEARYDEVAGIWIVRLESGESIRARALVSACGLFNSPIVPTLENTSCFAGPHFHSAEWDESFDPTHLTIGVVGAGCSAAQFVPEIVERAKKVILFQRTPAFVGPRPEKLFSPLTRRLFRMFPFLRRLDRLRIYWRYEGNFDVHRSSAVRAARLSVAQGFVAREIRDPDKRSKLMPATQAGCKRNVRSGKYLKALDRDNVEIVTASLRRFHTDGLETVDGKTHRLDALIYGTGFAASDYLSTFRVIGSAGQDLREVWRDGAEAYLGVTLAGFPNLFMIYGPNTNAPGSIVFMIECQIGYILKCLHLMQQRGARRLEVRPEVQNTYNSELQTRLARTAWASGCTSYFMNAAGRIVTQFPDVSRRYWKLTRRLRKNDFMLK